MKLRALLLSFLFIVTTTISALHELEHITHDHDDDTCLVYHLNDKLSPVSISDVLQKQYQLYFEITPYSHQVSNLHIKDKSNPNRAPPLLS